MLDLLIVGYIVCVGFVVVGILGSFYQLVISQLFKFNFVGEIVFGFLIGVIMCIFVGLFIIMCNVICGCCIENWFLGWLVVFFMIVGMWSMCLGLMVMYVVLIVVGYV